MRKIVIIFATLTMTPGIALAGTLGLVDDPGLHYLAQIFGSGLFSGGTGQTTAVMASLSALMTILLIGASGFFTWQIITAVMQTAHHGEVLGKEWSSLWVPIRFVAAGAMMIPAGTGGAIMMQQIVAWCVTLGLNLGLATANLAAGSILGGSPISAAAPPSVENLADLAWEMAVCNATLAQYGQFAGSANSPHISGGATNGTTTTWSVPAQNRQDGVDCPSIAYSAPGGANQAIGAAWNNAVAGLLSSLQPLANQAILASRPDAPAGTSAPTPGQIAQAVAAAQTQLNSDIAGATTSVASAVNSSNSTTSTNGSLLGAMSGGGSVGSQLASCGWFCFGAAYNTLAEANSSFSLAVNSQPASTAGVVATGSPADTNNEDTRPGLLLSKRLWELHTNPAQANWQPPAGGYGTYAGSSKAASATAGSGSAGGGVEDKILSKIQGFSASLASFFAGDWLANFADGAGPNPLARLSGLGSTVRAASIDFGTAISVLSALPLVGDSAARFFGSGIGAMLQTALSAMLWAGTFLVDILPLLPAAMWFFGVIGWLILVGEALIAAPFWAFAHLKAGGTGLHGEAGQGYAILLNLTMRPALMVAGMLLGMGIFSVGVNYLAQLMSIAIMDAGSQGATAQVAAAVATLGISMLISWAAKFCFLVLLMTSLAIMTFGLIHKLPDQVMRWLGGMVGGDAYGAGDHADGARGKIGMIAGTVKGGGAPRMPGRGKDKQPAGIENGDAPAGESAALPSAEAGAERT